MGICECVDLEIHKLLMCRCSNSHIDGLLICEYVEMGMCCFDSMMIWEFDDM